MNALLCILLLAASAGVDLVDQVYEIPANEWRYVEVGLRQRPGFVTAHYAALAGSAEVRLALMRREELERLRSGLPHGIMAVTSAGRSGTLEYRVQTPGDYVVVVDNLAPERASVHLRIRLDFTDRMPPGVITLSPQRRTAVILISFGVFLAVVSWSTYRLLRAVRR